MIKVSDLRDRIELFTPGQPRDDGYTTRSDGFQSEGDFWAKYMPGTVREVFEASARESVLPAVFLVRKDDVTETVNGRWKLVHLGNAYDVEGATPYGTDGILIRAISSDNPWGGDGGIST
jgi:hypothetical protein